MKKAYCLLVLLLLLGSMRAFAADINTDYNHTTNFSQYKTYSWIKVQAGDSLWADRIQQDVDAQLAAKGWTKVAANGNASVSALETTQSQNTLETFYDGSEEVGGGVAVAVWAWQRLPLTSQRSAPSLSTSSIHSLSS
jgi:hypothetical protein